MLRDKVQEESDPQGRWGGPLKTTFLVAMATPMVVLPVERLFKPVVQGRAGVANDAAVVPELDERIAGALGRGKALREAPFYRPGAWSYVADVEAFEVGANWPEGALRALADPEAAEAAAVADAGQILAALRNSLAHGGVTYLDACGGHTEFATNMLGFASLVRPNDPSRLRLLRIPVPAFENFLMLWAAWLETSGVAEHLERSGPGYFEHAAE
jgi:hypothetical protein